MGLTGGLISLICVIIGLIGLIGGLIGLIGSLISLIGGLISGGLISLFSHNLNLNDEALGGMGLSISNLSVSQSRSSELEMLAHLKKTAKTINRPSQINRHSWLGMFRNVYGRSWMFWKFFVYFWIFLDVLEHLGIFGDF